VNDHGDIRASGRLRCRGILKDRKDNDGYPDENYKSFDSGIH